jgi:hypothetical protein
MTFERNNKSRVSFTLWLPRFAQRGPCLYPLCCNSPSCHGLYPSSSCAQKFLVLCWTLCPSFDLFMRLCLVHKRVCSIVKAIRGARCILHGMGPTLEYMCGALKVRGYAFLFIRVSHGRVRRRRLTIIGWSMLGWVHVNTRTAIVHTSRRVWFIVTVAKRLVRNHRLILIYWPLWLRDVVV